LSDRSEQWKGTACLNCGKTLEARFCKHCGQPVTDPNQTALAICADFLEHFLSFDNSLWRSIKNLIGRPGLLTKEYIKGRRISYVSPIKLYLLMSLVCVCAANLLDKQTFDAANKTYSSLGVYIDWNDHQQPAVADSASSAPNQTGRSQGELLASVVSLLPQPAIPRLLIVMMPLCALLFKLAYFRRRRPFLHFFILSMHVLAIYFLGHAICITAGATLGVAGRYIASACYLGLMLNIFLAMRRLFGGRIVITAIKLLFVYCTFWICLLAILYAYVLLSGYHL